MELFRVAIVGGREFNDYALLSRYVNHMLSTKMKTHKVIINCGTARGADTLGERYAIERGLQVNYFRPDWNKEGKSAGHKRNIQMLSQSDAVIAFWDGISPGTKHMIQSTKAAGKPVAVKHY